MRSRFKIRERLWLGGSAFAAVVGAHALTFFLAAPAHHDRADLLHETGHGSWTNMFILAGALFLGALVAFGSRWASPSDRDVRPTTLFTHAFKRLLPLQAVGFLALESAERLFEQSSALEALSEPIVWLGVAVQVVAALVCALLLVAFTRLVRRILRASTAFTPRAAAPQPRTPKRASLVPKSVASLAWNLRGPPPAPRSR